MAGVCQMRKQHGFAEVNGTRLYYEVAGSGHPLVLIHGNTLDTRMWDDQFDTFAEHYRVVRYDLRGLGKSALPTGQSYAHADDLKGLMEHLGIIHAHILGLSMGGRIAIEFALAYPEATDTLIPVDSSLRRYGDRGRGALNSIYSSKAKEAGIPAARELWLDNPLFKPALEKPGVAFRLVRIISDYSGWHWTNDDPVRAPDPPAIEQLDKINVPTLIIVGARDTPRVLDVADILQQRITNARRVVIPDVGHMSNMEDPDTFNKIVLSFLANL